MALNGEGFQNQPRSSSHVTCAAPFFSTNEIQRVTKLRPSAVRPESNTFSRDLLSQENKEKKQATEAKSILVMRHQSSVPWQAGQARLLGLLELSQMYGQVRRRQAADGEDHSCGGTRGLRLDGILLSFCN